MKFAIAVALYYWGFVMPYPSRLPRAQRELIRENDGLKTTIVCLRREIENKEGAVGRLEILLRERLAKVDESNAKLEQARAQNRRLDEECERLVEMVRLPPSIIAI